ncbi:uncharacterized protein LOC118436166 [Folsomia candida]|uniref:uncharacterized protein LOC118436166 n=1 Tax=Folsomia candida TaxID=158441 RepID=UPI00160543BF|nr:uncharacterized protein LOC118436166 [Folsomia candida]
MASPFLVLVAILAHLHSSTSSQLAPQPSRINRTSDGRGPELKDAILNASLHQADAGQELNTTLPPTDGPLVPFLIEGGTTLLYEAVLSGEDDEEDSYISPTYLGKQITCEYTQPDPNTGLFDPKTYPDYNCNLYIRHIKPISHLIGFRQMMLASVIKPIALIFCPTYAVIYLVPQSNVALVMMTTLNYTELQVGWTQWFPTFTAVLLQGFPYPEDHSIMWGYATQFSYSEVGFSQDPHNNYFLDMSTKKYRERRLRRPAGGGENLDEVEWREFVGRKKEMLGDEFVDPLERLEEVAHRMYAKLNVSNPRANGSRPSAEFEVQQKDTFWRIEDSGCHHRIELVENPVLKGDGGLVTLDLHDSISFTIRALPLTAIGRLSMYRPLFVITNSHPEVLSVVKKHEYDSEAKIQTAKVMLSPTGKSIGTSNITIRATLSSIQCAGPNELTYTVQVDHEKGRRLWVNFPIPICKSGHFGRDRPWKEDKPYCIDPHVILEAGNAVSSESHPKKIHIQDSTPIFIKLPINYRPPSIRGEEIPLSTHTYNADPSKPAYHNYYHITNDTRKLRKCNFRSNRSECGCSDADKLADDPEVSDCKEMVYTVPRAKSFQVSLDYDPVMREQDQIPEFFRPKDHFSVYIEEINNRREFTLYSQPTPLLDAINSDVRLHEGRGPFYNAQNITITLHGTGLFHFKAGLGKFDSFGEVTGYFTVYSDSNELNHIKLVVVMLLTITFCFSLIFLGFMRVRKRLSSQLPFQTREKTKFKME